jgi:hypothetical protein
VAPQQCGCTYDGLYQGLYKGPRQVDSALYDVCRVLIIQKGIGRRVGNRHTSCILREGASGACLPWHGSRSGGRPILYMKNNVGWKRDFLLERGLSRQSKRRWAKVSVVPLLWAAFRSTPLPTKITSSCKCANPYHYKRGTGPGGRQASLTMAQKREINYLNSNHTLSRMAAMFGVSERTISRAIKK